MPSFFTGLAELVANLTRRPWTIWAGLRYLQSRKSSRFLNFITAISVVGIWLGVTAMIVVLSVMDGFETELKKRLMATDLHVWVTPKKGATLSGDRFTSDPAFKLGWKGSGEVELISPVLQTEAILKTGNKVTGVVVKGIDAAREKRLTVQVVQRVERREDLAPEAEGMASLWVGREMAEDLAVVPGDFVTLISPTETEGPLSKIPRLKRFWVEGIFHTGLPDQEATTVFARMPAVRSFLRQSQGVTGFEITLKNFDHAQAFARELSAQASDLDVKDWSALNSSLFFSLRLERAAMSVILAFIVVVASFNIVTTLTLMVMEKRKEIAILKTMGARDSEVGSVFLAQGLSIGALGVMGGVLTALAISGILKQTELIQLPEVYYDRTLPVHLNPYYYLGVSGVALGIVLVACLYPAKKAVKLTPLEGLRQGA